MINSIRSNRFRISDHADQQAQDDNLIVDEILKSVLNGEIIEEYFSDYPYPSCLIFGMNQKDEPIHSVWGYNKETGASVLITVYRPDLSKWKSWKERKLK